MHITCILICIISVCCKDANHKSICSAVSFLVISCCRKAMEFNLHPLPGEHRVNSQSVWVKYDTMAWQAVDRLLQGRQQHLLLTWFAISPDGYSFWQYYLKTAAGCWLVLMFVDGGFIWKCVHFVFSLRVQD